MKKVLLLVLVAIMALGVVACAPADTTQSDLDYIKEKGKMVIGYTVYAPMNYEDENGELTGFDTELAKLVCEELGVEPEFNVINWDTKETLLAGKSIDVIWNGFTLDEERKQNFACSDPYVKNAQVVLVKEGTEYTDTSSLIGKTVVAELDSAGETQIKGDSADENLAQSDYVGKGTQAECLLELKAGTATAAVVDMTLANAMTGEGTDYQDIKIVDYLAEEEYGIAFRKESNVAEEVNTILDKLEEDGTLKELADKYNLELVD